MAKAIVTKSAHILCYGSHDWVTLTPQFTHCHPPHSNHNLGLTSVWSGNWTLRLLVISPTAWTVRLQIAHFAYKTARIK